MAIKNIKEIINNKGYVIDPRDRKIFEDGDLQSFFGFSNTDAIEFIIYDANDNQLPQLNGDLVRYINLTDENIRDYFLIPEGTLVQQFSLPTEYFIDVERLLQEAGYSNGIFKTQVTLVNKRAGSEKEFDKLWIQEISPSRNEIRLFPLKKGTETNSELKQRFEIFVRGSQFREDVIQIAFEILEQITPDTVGSFLRGKYGEKWFKNFINEFKIKDLDTLTTQIHESFVKSATYEFTNRHSKIGESNYGTNKLVNPPLSMSKNDIVNTIKRILIETIYYYLPERDINKNKEEVNDFLSSEDNVTDVLQTEKSDTRVPPKVVAIEQVDVVKRTNPVEELPVIGVFEEIAEDPDIPNEEVPDVKTPDGEPEYDEVIVDETDTTPIEEDDSIINFDDFFDIIDDVVVLKPIETEDTGIDYNDDRVDIPDEIVIDDRVFEITPLPNDIVGGSPVSGEGAQGSPTPGAGATSSPGLPIGNQEFSNPQDAIDNEFRYRTKIAIREL
jgi:hypothetical protein